MPDAIVLTCRSNEVCAPRSVTLGETGFHIEFDRAPTTKPIYKRASTPETLKLAVLDGSTERSTYTFALSRINLGRCTEVRDSRNRLIGTNHVAFVDTQVEPNQTVSRRHAHIDYVTETGTYRVCDD